MATLLSKFVTRQAAVTVGDCAGDIVANDFYIDLAVGDLLINNIIDIGILPAGHTVSGVHLIPDDLDSNGTPTITLDVGILSGVPGDSTSVRTVGQEFFVASTAAQTGTPVSSALKSMYTLLPLDYDRSIGVKIVAAPATAVAGRIRLRVTVYPTNSNFQY